MADEDVFIIPVDDYANQVQDFTKFGYTLQFTLRFNAIGTSWSFDLYDVMRDEFIVKNEGLSIAQPSLYYSEMPFVVTMLDNSGLGFESIDQQEMGDRISVAIMSVGAYENAIWWTHKSDNR